MRLAGHRSGAPRYSSCHQTEFARSERAQKMPLPIVEKTTNCPSGPAACTRVSGAGPFSRARKCYVPCARPICFDRKRPPGPPPTPTLALKVGGALWFEPPSPSSLRGHYGFRPAAMDNWGDSCWSPLDGACGPAFASPKSSTFTEPSGFIFTFRSSSSFSLWNLRCQVPFFSGPTQSGRTACRVRVLLYAAPG